MPISQLQYGVYHGADCTNFHLLKTWFCAGYRCMHIIYVCRVYAQKYSNEACYFCYVTYILDSHKQYFTGDMLIWVITACYNQYILVSCICNFVLIFWLLCRCCVRGLYSVYNWKLLHILKLQCLGFATDLLQKNLSMMSFLRSVCCCWW